jgi:diguanylate cyclase (GGDEF)-like protein
MTDTLPDTEVSPELRQRVFLERLSIYYHSLSVSVVAIVVNSLLLAYLLWTPENSTVVLSWCGITLVIAAFRISSIVRFRRQDEHRRESRSRGWYVEMLVGSVLSGVTWGLVGYLLFDVNNSLSQSLLAFIIAGMCAGSIVSLSTFVEASSAFLCLSLLPFTARLFMVGTQETRIMAAIAILYLVMMVIFARRVNATVINGLEMTYLRSQAEDTIERQALYDELTGLPNRRLLQDRLSQAIARARRRNSAAALMFFDLDYFKRVNDSLGHVVGDQLLREIANRVSALLRDEDTAARIGGDEFVALLTDIEGTPDKVISMVRRRGEELRLALAEPVHVNGNELHVSASIGVSLLPGDTDNADDLLKHADTAMYRAKDEGRNTLRFFVRDMENEIAQRMTLERQLRAALARTDELKLYLQPQYDKDRAICGAECLLRWERDGAFIAPGLFIPVAEDSGLIYQLGNWVVEEACRVAAQLIDLVADREFSLAFNVSPRQFRKSDFVDKVLKAVDNYALPRGLMELELTEGLLIDNVEDAIAKMLCLREAGLRFSIDDFGTGYSSLRYLKSLPLDTLKVDQSFVSDVLANPGDASIVRAIISMAHTLELNVIAEGVETEDVHEFLVTEGCERFQGYLFSRPVPLAEFRELLLACPGSLQKKPA